MLVCFYAYPYFELSICQAEYADPETLWDRVNDAISTIIRRDESSETGQLLPPCVEGNNSVLALTWLLHYVIFSETCNMCFVWH